MQRVSEQQLSRPPRVAVLAWIRRPRLNQNHLKNVFWRSNVLHTSEKGHGYHLLCSSRGRPGCHSDCSTAGVNGHALQSKTSAAHQGRGSNTPITKKHPKERLKNFKQLIFDWCRVSTGLGDVLVVCCSGLLIHINQTSVYFQGQTGKAELSVTNRMSQFIDSWGY